MIIIISYDLQQNKRKLCACEYLLKTKKMFEGRLTIGKAAKTEQRAGNKSAFAWNAFVLNRKGWITSATIIDNLSRFPVSSEISDLLLFVSYFASQSIGIKFGDYFFDVCCVHSNFLVTCQIPTTSYSTGIRVVSRAGLFGSARVSGRAWS